MTGALPENIATPTHKVANCARMAGIPKVEISNHVSSAVQACTEWMITPAAKNARPVVIPIQNRRPVWTFAGSAKLENTAG